MTKKTRKKKSTHLNTGGTTLNSPTEHDPSILFFFQFYRLLPEPHWVGDTFQSWQERKGKSSLDMDIRGIRFIRAQNFKICLKSYLYDKI